MLMVIVWDRASDTCWLAVILKALEERGWSLEIVSSLTTVIFKFQNALEIYFRYSLIEQWSGLVEVS